jgi:predicted Zn finger-like uncharacterized protein
MGRASVIVGCERCGTRFRLDESKLPKQGARVRCSRCKHAFFLRHPDVSEREALDAVAAQATSQGEPSPPEPASDLAPRTEAPASPPDPSTRLSASTAAAEANEESDWEFNSDPPAPARDAAAEAKAAREGKALDAFLGAEESPASSSLDELGDPSSWDFFSAEKREKALPVETVEAPEEPPPPASVSTEAPSVSLEGPSVSLEAPSVPLEALDPPSELAAPSLDPAHGSIEAPSAPLEALGAPTVEATPSIETASVRIGVLGSPPREARRSFEAARRSLEVETSGASASSEPSLDSMPTSASGERGAAAHAFTALGWTATVVLLLLTVYGTLGGPRADPAPVVDASILAGMSLEDVRGRTVENAPGGLIYLVSGRFRNQETRWRGLEASVVVRLLGPHGRPIPGVEAIAGRPLPLSRLREQDPRALRALHEQGVERFATRAVAPGHAVPFEAVFERFPPQAQTVEVQAEPLPAPLREAGQEGAAAAEPSGAFAPEASDAAARTGPSPPLPLPSSG